MNKEDWEKFKKTDDYINNINKALAEQNGTIQ